MSGLFGYSSSLASLLANFKSLPHFVFVNAKLLPYTGTSPKTTGPNSSKPEKAYANLAAFKPGPARTQPGLPLPSRIRPPLAGLTGQGASKGGRSQITYGEGSPLRKAK